MTLTDAEDRSLRRYAKRLDGELGEDAYHDAVVRVLSARVPLTIVSETAVLINGTKWALHRLWTERETDQRCLQSYINGDPSPQMVNLRKGREPRTTCKKGLHDMTDENIYWSQGVRGCRACRRARGNANKRAQRAGSS
jgi:hypothetical protein